MENVQKTRRLFASAYGCKASRSFLIWGLSAAMFISVIPMMAEVLSVEKTLVFKLLVRQRILPEPLLMKQVNL